MKGLRLLKYGLTISFIIGFNVSRAQPSRYLIQFTDSININNKHYEYISRVDLQLSQTAVERRKKQHIKIENSDYAVTPQFIDSLSKYQVQIIRPSRWLYGVLAVIADTNVIGQIKKLEFVKSILYLGKLPDETTPANFDLGNIQTKTEEWNGFQRAYYDKGHKNPRKQGFSYDQLKTIFDSLVDEKPSQKVDFSIAIIDAGFRNVNLIPCFKHLFSNNLLQGTYDFSSNDTMVFDDDDHGTKVLSCIAGFDQGNYSGSAPFSKFWLLRSEESYSETLSEEVLWCLAAEWADSVGCGLISSSLGYNYFDDSEHSHSYQDMDGEHTIIAKAVKIAASKGITVITSSGNEGDKAWHYITTPGDSKYALTLGASDKKGEQAYFSSMGPAADGRIKPDITCWGYETVVCTRMGNYTQANGSSFSTPMMAGFVAHLKQDFPIMADSILFDAIRSSATQASNPDYKVGFGIPNYSYAYKLLKFYQSSNFSEVLCNFNKTDNSIEIRKLNDGKNCRVLLKAGNNVLNEYNHHESHEANNRFTIIKLRDFKHLKKGKKYSIEVIGENKKTLSMSHLVAH